MSERKLEPTPGWCERAQKMLVLYTNRAHFASQLIAEYEAAQKSGLLKYAGTWKGDDFEDCLAAVKPKPAPLPHEPCDYATLTCKHCGYDQKRNLYFWQERCPARSVPPHDNMKQGWSGTGDRSHDRVPKCGSNPPPVASSPPAEKAEVLPVNVAAVYWLSDAICRSAAYSPATVQKAIYSLIEHILAEVDKRIDRRGDAIGDRVAGLLLSNADAMGLIARDEISKAVVHAFNANVDDFVPRPDLYRIVPGKEGE